VSTTTIVASSIHNQPVEQEDAFLIAVLAALIATRCCPMDVKSIPTPTRAIVVRVGFSALKGRHVRMLDARIRVMLG
jgi:hypothetical protein